MRVKFNFPDYNVSNLVDVKEYKGKLICEILVFDKIYRVECKGKKEEIKLVKCWR